MSPRGVAEDGEGNILVAYSNCHRIEKFTEQGNFLTAVGTGGRGPLTFDFPYGIAVSASNGRAYVGSWNGHIKILNSDLSYIL